MNSIRVRENFVKRFLILAFIGLFLTLNAKAAHQAEETISVPKDATSCILSISSDSKTLFPWETDWDQVANYQFDLTCEAPNSAPLTIAFETERHWTPFPNYFRLARILAWQYFEQNGCFDDVTNRLKKCRFIKSATFPPFN